MGFGNQGTLICLTISNNALDFFSLSFSPRQTEMNCSKKILCQMEFRENVFLLQSNSNYKRKVKGHIYIKKRSLFAEYRVEYSQSFEIVTVPTILTHILITVYCVWWLVFECVIFHDLRTPCSIISQSLVCFLFEKPMVCDCIIYYYKNGYCVPEINYFLV